MGLERVRRLAAADLVVKHELLDDLLMRVTEVEHELEHNPVEERINNIEDLMMRLN